MGKADVQALCYFQDSRVFADMINAYFFGGKQIIRSEELKEADKELVHAQTDQVNRVLRDSVKKYFKEMLLCIFVLEHQKNIDYHMVIRRMLAEAMEYHRQWRRLKKRHRENKDLKKGHEWISGMNRQDKFVPVLSLVVYYGEDRWEAATCIHELLDMDCLPEVITKYIENYHIHVFDYHDYKDYEMFRTELKQVFSFLKHASDKEKLKNFIAEHREEYYNVSIETCELIESLTNSKKLLEWKEYRSQERGGVNMYNVFLELRQEGIEQGIEQGIKALIETCWDFGKSKEETASKIIQKFLLSPSEANLYLDKYWLS